MAKRSWHVGRTLGDLSFAADLWEYRNGRADILFVVRRSKPNVVESTTMATESGRKLAARWLSATDERFIELCRKHLGARAAQRAIAEAA